MRLITTFVATQTNRFFTVILEELCFTEVKKVITLK